MSIEITSKVNWSSTTVPVYYVYMYTTYYFY